MSIEEFYNYCIQHNLTDKKLMVYFITDNGDVTASGELNELAIRVVDNQVWLYFDD